MGYFSHSILVTELNFALKICKFWFFWNSCEIPEFIMEFEKIVSGYDMGHQFHFISSTEFKSTAQNVIYAQLKKFEIYITISTVTSVCLSIRCPVSVTKKFFRLNHLGITPGVDPDPRGTQPLRRS